MENDDRELVEKMNKAYFTRFAKEPMKEVLSVVKANIGEIAEICPCVRHAMATGVDISAGCSCGGSGVVAKNKEASSGKG